MPPFYGIKFGVEGGGFRCTGRSDGPSFLSVPFKA
jgi:hypothetical protein